MNILVTGGTGFIGSYLVKDLIKQNYKIKILTRKRNKFNDQIEEIVGNITKFEDCLNAMNNVDVVFHNAAYATDFGKKNEINEININGTKNILKACEINGVNRIIYTSTAGVYGFPNNLMKINEKSKIQPYNTYHKSKFEGEKILSKNEKIKLSIIRPPLVLGANGAASKIIIDKILNGQMIYVGSGNQYIPIAHASDVAQCLILALEKDKVGEIFNVVSFHCKIRDLFIEISKKLKIKPPEKNIPYFLAFLTAYINEKLKITEPSLTRFRVKSLGTSRIISCDKAIKKLKFKANFDLKMTVEDMIADI
jgi:nucleoside-diphosphate-sugar epimerase